MKCGICLVFMSLKEGDYFVTTQCGHIYHYECLRCWISQSSQKSNAITCPTCRSKMSLETVVKLHDVSPAEIKPSRKLLHFKFVIIGDSGTGKTCLINQFAKGIFVENHNATIGCDLYLKNIEVCGKIIALSIWDCAGQDLYRAITPNYMRKAHGVFLVYEISKSESIDNLQTWMTLVRDYAPSDVAIILCGNKSDLNGSRKIPKSQGEALANELGLNFFETSGKEDHNVEAAFRTLTAQILEGMHRDGFTQGLHDSVGSLTLSDNGSISRSTETSCGC